MPPGQPDRLRLHLAVSALRTQLRSVRSRLAEWAGRSGLADDEVDDVVLAAYEALVNVVDHAYAGRDGDVWLDAVRNGQGLEVTVVDRGVWRPVPADPGLRGRGMRMIASLADRVTVDRGRGGTTVTMHWLLGQAHPGDPARSPRPGR